jgi:hypothetical protein
MLLAKEESCYAVEFIFMVLFIGVVVILLGCLVCGSELESEPIGVLVCISSPRESNLSRRWITSTGSEIKNSVIINLVGS